MSPTPFGQAGASLVEFVVVAPVLLFLGLGTLQVGLAYHAKVTLNYATLEAARTGAVRHATLAPMERELAIRLSAVQGGDGSASGAVKAITSSMIDLHTPGLGAPYVSVEILNPTVEAFADWGRTSRESGRRVIPNSHLRHFGTEVGATSGVNVRDANLLKIEATHGFELDVPIVGTVIAKAMEALEHDPRKRAYYARGKLPLRSTATVRMQSEAWQDDIGKSPVAPPPAEETVPVDSLAGERDEEGSPPGETLEGDAGEEENEGDDAVVECSPASGYPTDAALPEADPFSCGMASTPADGGRLPPARGADDEPEHPDCAA